MFLQTVAEEDATGAIAEVYRKEKEGAGFVPEAARCLSTRPDMPPLFDTFFDGIKANFSLSGREWCLITFVAATHLRSTYCSQVYSQRLLGAGESKRRLRSSATTAPPASDKDMAMLAYAEKVTVAATRSRSRHRPVALVRLHGPEHLRYRPVRSFRCMLSKMVVRPAPCEPAFPTATRNSRRHDGGTEDQGSVIRYRNQRSATFRF
jgi:alkylhydroperoxidase family enzyme